MGFIRHFTSNDVKDVVKKSGFDYVKIISLKEFNLEDKEIMTGMTSIIIVGKKIPKSILENSNQLIEEYCDEINMFNSINIVLEKLSATGANVQQLKNEKDNSNRLGIFSEMSGLKRIEELNIYVSNELEVPLQIEFILTNLKLESDSIAVWEEDNRYCIECTKDVKESCNNKCNKFDYKYIIKSCKWIAEYLKKDDLTNILTREDNRDISCEKMIIATIGPSGTCSENASKYYIQLQNKEGEIKLFSTFEDAVEAVINKEADYLIIPSAYRKIADIIFQNRYVIEIDDVFRMETPGLVIAYKENMMSIKTVATHSTPLILAKEYFGLDVEFIISNSNGESARLLLDGTVDACVTTIKCVNMFNFNVLYDFGSISMGWNVFKRKNERSF